VDKAQTFDEAITKAKAVKRRHPESRVEIEYSGITAEMEWHSREVAQLILGP
jgi:hypothetical protein